MLQEDVERYELMGYDYVLDLVSEMEIAPGFPHGSAYFLVSVDRSIERMQRKRHNDDPHNAEKERIVVLVGPLPDMVRRNTPVVSAAHMRPSAISPTPSARSANEDLGFSTTSVLNQRPTEILQTAELSESRINQRYTKRQAPAPPNGHIPNGHVNGHMNGSVVNGDMSSEDILDLSQTRINGRYFPDSVPNGVPNGHVENLSPSRLNSRYKKSAVANPLRKSGIQDQIRKKQGVGMTTADVHSDVHSEHSDWSHWVEDVFNDALNDHDEMPLEGKSLHSRIKGGGKGVPGIQTQQVRIGGFRTVEPVYRVNTQRD